MAHLWLRHQNGNGRVYDDSEICEVSIATAKSNIKSHSSVWSSKIIDSTISGSTITNAVINRSVIRQTLVSGGCIENSIVKCEIVTGNAEISNCKVLGASRIAHNAKLSNVAIKNLTVKGEAVLENWHIKDVFDGCFGYVSHGIWQRPPKLKRLDCGFTVTESVPGFAYVGCYQYEILHWLKIGDKYGKVFGLKCFEVEEIRQFLRNLL